MRVGGRGAKSCNGTALVLYMCRMLIGGAEEGQ